MRHIEHQYDHCQSLACNCAGTDNKQQGLHAFFAKTQKKAEKATEAKSAPAATGVAFLSAQDCNNPDALPESQGMSVLVRESGEGRFCTRILVGANLAIQY